ncbi:carbohydrate ABC transporter permease [Paenibacillus eucommiae]|uniref:Aldouronate transport system permease protein n=1 Tax=Paenibacillus eucommiae TaxID=1355755 RepID=A0ABS4J7B4_9BACL|nr:carbohydrate ABC transporter permease [Paenibacillus eucommiae]MBP1995739.1 putative aldouronate transport system permease protein [Paenibacillus eucommiae]
MSKSLFKMSIGQMLVYVIVLLCCIVTLVPILHVFSMSFSSGEAVQKSILFLYPKDFTLQAYRYIFDSSIFPKAFGVTVLVTVVGTFLNMVMTILGAYSLSRRAPGTGLMLLFIVIAMILPAGMIPVYLLVKNLHLLDTLWALIIPGMVAPFYLILMRNFFWGIPDALIESAQMEGSSEWRTMAQIIVPLSAPVLATIGLFYAVGHWNDFFKGIFYINDRNLWPLQVLLRSIVMQSDYSSMGAMSAMAAGKSNLVPETIQSAAIVVVTAPIVILYPFLQKYFVGGIVLGAVKG